MPEKAEGDKSKKPNVSRIQKMRDDLGDDDYSPDMPPCDAPHLVAYLYEIGPATPTGMGNAPLSYLEIQAWQDQIGVELQPWEVRLVRQLSIAYCNESQTATKHDAEAPWADAPYVKPARDVVLARVKAAFAF